MEGSWGGGYSGETALQTAQYDSPKMVRTPTMKERLAMAVTQAEERLASAKRARELFDKNPDLEELLNILQRSNF
jgi:hypothetical protein